MTKPSKLHKSPKLDEKLRGLLGLFIVIVLIGVVIFWYVRFGLWIE